MDEKYQLSQRLNQLWTTYIDKSNNLKQANLDFKEARSTFNLELNHPLRNNPTQFRNNLRKEAEYKYHMAENKLKSLTKEVQDSKDDYDELCNFILNYLDNN